MKFIRNLGLFLLMLMAIFLPLLSTTATAVSEQAYVINVDNTIETGLAQSLQRAIQKAETAQYKVILLKIDTWGGSIDAAVQIGELIRNSTVPVIAYVDNKAVSAGAYIALNAQHIAMAPGSTIGAAEPRTIDGETADPKTVAAWRAEMRSAAEATGHNGQIAEGMVDVKLEIPNLKKSGELLSLSAEDAVKLGVADGVFKSESEVLSHYGYGDLPIVEHKVSFAEKAARFLTNPFVIPVLLIIGVVGLVIEVLLPGVILPGVIGISAFGLFFFGNIVAGFSGWESLILFVIGITLLVIEIFVAGFGIIGFSGILAIGTSVGLAVYDAKYGIQAFLFALLFAGVAAWITIKYFGHRGAWNKLILKDQLTNEQGYSPVKSYTYLLYQEGKALTPLRPAGTAIILDQRLDVVTEGDFIQPGEPIVVVHVEGTRIVVRRKI